MVQLPALNTPQFDWSRSRLPRRAQPVPPIFQPEVAAKAILWASESGRREIWVGWPSVKAIVGNAVAPGIAARTLSEWGYESQQTDELRDPERPDNLFAPVGGDQGAHGRFDRRAKPRSLLLDGFVALSTPLARAALAGVALGSAAWFLRSRDDS
jgi:hypothetical protein